MMARRKIVAFVAGLAALCVVLGLAVGLGGCRDMTFNGDMKGYLEYWLDTVSVASARWSASPEQQTAGGRTTVATNATITASLSISNPEGYPLESVVSLASSGPHAVEVSGPAADVVLGLTSVTESTPTSLSVQVAPVSQVPTPASLALEHTDFTVKLSPTRSETAMQSPNPLVLSLRYNTPPRMPLAVIKDSSTGGFRWPTNSSNDKWEATPGNPLYYAWPQDKTKEDGCSPTDPDYVERFCIMDGGQGTFANPSSKEGQTLTGSDGTVYNIYSYMPNGNSVTIHAEDGEGVRGAGIISGPLVGITLDGNGGLFGSSRSVTVYRSDGSSLTGGDLEVPTMPGFYLSGWTEGGNTVTFPYTVSSPVTLVAQWTANPVSGGSGTGSGTGSGGSGGTTPNLYTVTYDGNGDDGTGAVPNEQAKFSGGTLTIKGNTGSLTRTGHTFDGWNTSKDGTGTDYAEGAVYTTDADLALYAKWTPVSYTITYNLDGGTPPVPDNPQGYTVEDLTITLEAPTKTGYTFVGWYKDDGSKVTTIDQGTTGNITLTAKWTANTYTVSFDGNGNDGGSSMGDETFTYADATQSLPANGFTRTGYTFAGWKGSNGQSYADGQSVGNLTADPNGTITLTAQWTANKYTVEFNDNGVGGGSMTPQQFTYDAAQTLTTNGFTPPTGCTFAGWKDNAGNVYIDGQSVSNLTDVPNGTVTLTARWMAVGYIAYGDGTASENYVPGKTAVGVVIGVDSSGSVKIVALQESKQQFSPAETYCEDYTDASGNKEWYLPNKDELNLVYQAKTAVNGALQKIGNGQATPLTDDWYWSSSTESNSISSYSWRQNFGDGKAEKVNRLGLSKPEHWVRAIRAF